MSVEQRVISDEVLRSNDARQAVLRACIEDSVDPGRELTAGIGQPRTFDKDYKPVDSQWSLGLDKEEGVQ